MLKHFVVSLIAVLAMSFAAWAQTESAKIGLRPCRHVFILHDGVHTILSETDPAWATKYLRYFLRKQGVPDNDIIVMDFPFPVASWDDMFPADAVTDYLDSMKPDSQISRQTYLRLDRALAEHGVLPEDKLIWIGHSAGGQVGMTMAHLGSCLSKYPDLARQAAPHPFDMVVTLGAPLGADLVPASVKQRHYYSPKDIVVRLSCDYGHMFLKLLGHNALILPTPPRLHDNIVVRIFDGCDHGGWPDGWIVARILAECRGDDQRPEWRRFALAPAAGPGLASLLSEALEEQCRLSIEDPFD